MIRSYIYDYVMCNHIIITYTTTHKTSCLESCWDSEFNPVSVPSVSWSQFIALVAEVVQVGWVENSDTYVECEYAKLHLAFPPEMHIGKWFHRLETCIKANNWKATAQALKLSGLCLATATYHDMLYIHWTKRVPQSVILVKTDSHCYSPKVWSCSLARTQWRT